MPQTSRYSNERVEQLLHKLVMVFEEDAAPTNLSLMVLGNMVTNLINSDINPSQRRAIAKAFTQALENSILDENCH